MPKNTRRRNQWAINTFNKWAIQRNNTFLPEHQGGDDRYTKIMHLVENMSVEELCYWICKFVLEVRKENKKEYPPKSLLSLSMGIQGHIRTTAKKSINFLQDKEFEEFRQTLDAEMKRLSAQGLGSDVRKAQPFTQEEEDQLWKSKQLGDFSPRVLVRTVLYLVGRSFGLRGGEEHRRLRFRPPQITLHEPAGKTPYLCYIEDVSKVSQGGLKHRRVQKKEVKQHGNLDNPERCFVRIYKKYMEMSPQDRRDNSFYLQPLQAQKPHIWYSRQPYGANTLAKFVKDMCDAAGITGYRTNHSLRATTATRLYQSGVDEMLIMHKTGHRSVEGERILQLYHGVGLSVFMPPDM